MPLEHDNPVTAGQAQGCKVCGLNFQSYATFHRHKIQSSRHICCEACSMDFNTTKALKTHHDLHHSAEQHLSCPGCGMVFSRMGGLMAHIELVGCSSIDKNKVEVLRKMKGKWHANYNNARGFQDYGCSAGAFRDDPGPFGASSATLNISNLLQSSCQLPALISADTSNLAAFENGDDLISFDPVTTILNSPWNSANEPGAVSQENNLPTNLTISIPDALPSLINSSLGDESLIPNAPAANAPPSELLADLSISRNVDGEDHDPGHPNFDAEKFWILVLGKYKCPRNGCTKSFPSKFAFIQHLKSSAHRNEKLQCHSCLRYFGTATALTQHCESQGVRCKVRETTEYNGVVDVITAGTARIAGRHDDKTLKYAINLENFQLQAPGPQNFIVAHQAAGEAKEKKFNNHWTGKKLSKYEW